MDAEYFSSRIRGVNWVKYLSAEYFNPNEMDFSPEGLVKALIELSRLDEERFTSGNLSQVRFAIGNDHRGTYYPAALDAVDILIEIEQTCTNSVARRAARDVLNDLHYFQLEMGSDDETLYSEINGAIRKMLAPYADENE